MASPDERTVGELQDEVIESALTGRPLPGLGSPLRLPDLGIVRRGGAVRMVADGYLGSPEGLPQVQVVAPDELEPGAAALRFEVPERRPDAVLVVLEVVGIPPGGERTLTPLSRAQLTFERLPDGWQVTGDPVYLST